MTPIKLDFSVKTLEGRELLPAGSVLDEKTLAALTAQTQSSPPKTYPLMGYGSIQDEIRAFLKASPYDIIFDDGRGLAEVMDVMKTVRFVQPVLDVLDYFRAQDFMTYRHMLTVFALTILIAHDLVPDYRNRVSEIAYGPTHDFGKICVPLKILRKIQPLTREELAHLQHHTLAGYVLLSHYFGNSRSIAAVVARDHHERRNGCGYPRGIEQQDILVEIVTACDIYDALISARPYRPVSYDNRTALEELTAMARKGEIGWRVVQALIARNRASKPAYRDAAVSLEKRGTMPPGNTYGKLENE